MTQLTQLKKKKKTPKTQKFQKNETKKESSRPPSEVDKRAEAENNLREMIKEAHKLHKDHLMRSSKGKLTMTVSESVRRAPRLVEGSKRTDGTKRTEAEKVKARPMGSEEFPRRQTDAGNRAERRGSFDLPARKVTRRRVSGERRTLSRRPEEEEEEKNLRIKDYQVGGKPFVSLDLLDRMKCHGSDLCMKERKASRTKEEGNGSGKSKETSREASKSNLKRSRVRKTKAGKVAGEGKAAEGGARRPPAAKEKTKVRTRRANAVRESALPSRESSSSSEVSRRMPAVGTPASETDSSPSSFIGAGDPFSSNTSRSYMSSESDISKIDRKFMEILEAVTQNNLRLELDESSYKAGGDQFRAVDGGEASRDNADNSRQLGQKILQRINSLERKLGTSKMEVARTPEVQEKETNAGGVGNTTVIVAPVVEELWIKDKATRKEQPIEERKVTSSDGKAGDTGDGLEQERQSQKGSREGLNVSTKPADTGGVEESREAEGEGGDPPAKTPAPSVNPGRSKTTFGREEAEERVTQTGTQCKPIGTWSIIKRLEKALQTLGLDLTDLDDSEDDSAGKKKTPARKRGSSGRGRRSGPRKAPNTDGSVTARRSAHTPEDKGGVESNGSGDRNVDSRAVKSSSKQEELARMPKEAGTRDRHVSDAYFASMRLRVEKRKAKCGEADGMSRGKLSEVLKTALPRKRGSQEMETPVEDKQSAKKSRLMGTRGGRQRASKRESNHSLRGSCSGSSPSEDDNFRAHKRKRMGSAACEGGADETSKVNSSGKGDAAPRAPTDGTAVSEVAVQRQTPGTSREILKMEKESDELELREMRERHRRIISEIRASLEEMKTQHNLYAELRDQTRHFSRDYRTKRKLIASYLRDVEESRRKRGGQSSEVLGRKRATSTDAWLKRGVNLRDKLSDYKVEIKRLKRRLRKRSQQREKPAEPSTEVTSVSDGVSSAGVNPRMAESSDTAEEFLCPCELSRELEETEARGAPPQEWKDEEDMKQVPIYLSKFLEKLNRIILTEKDKLEDLVVKASGSSNNSNTGRGKPTGMTHCPGCKHTKHQPTGTEEVTRTVSQGYKTTSPNTHGTGGERQHKAKSQGGKVAQSERPPDEDRGALVVRSRTQGDPGGCAKSCTHGGPTTECNHSEELRYRKGDPSFRSRESSAKSIGERERECRCKAPEDVEAHRRKVELERILRTNEGNLRKAIKHSLDQEPHGGRMRHSSLTRHRQQSIIIDHFGWEDNDESQTVLGHATRHCGIRKSDRRIIHEYYLQGGRRSESNYRKMHEAMKKAGKRHCLEDIPIHCRDLSANMPESTRCKDADCQTEKADDSDDFCDIYLLDDSGSGSSDNS